MRVCVWWAADACGADVMQVAHHWFENGIAHFTHWINKCILMGAWCVLCCCVVLMRVQRA